MGVATERLTCSLGPDPPWAAQLQQEYTDEQGHEDERKQSVPAEDDEDYQAQQQQLEMQACMNRHGTGIRELGWFHMSSASSGRHAISNHCHANPSHLP